MSKDQYKDKRSLSGKEPATSRQRRRRRKQKPRGNPMKSSALSIEECLAPPQKKKRKSLRKSTASNTENEAARERHFDSIAMEDKGSGGKARGTHVDKWILRVFTNSTEAIVFAQLHYWIKRSSHSPQPGRSLNLNWIAKNASDLASEVCRKKHVINRALKCLKDNGFITWENKKFAGQVCRHISIVWSKVEAEYLESRASQN